MSVDITIDVEGQSPGLPGESRDFLYSVIDGDSPTVTLSIDDDTGVTEWLWELVFKPIGSSAVLSSSTAPSPTFDATLDKAGTYLIQCTITRSAIEETERQCLSFRTEHRGFRIPAPDETIEFGSRGWDPAMDEFVKAMDVGDWLRLQSGGNWYLVPSNDGDSIRAHDGTQALPGYAFDLDGDTGFYRPDNNILGLSLGGREHVRFYNDGSGMVMSVDGGESGEYDQWDLKILHERTHSGPPAQIQIKTIAGTNGSQIAIHPTFTDTLSSGTAQFNAGATGGHALSTFSSLAGGDDIGADRNATAYLTASAYHGIGALYIDMFGRDQSSIRINSRVLAANAYLDLCATGNTNTGYTGGHIRIGFNDDSNYRPEHIQFHTKALQASAWTNKYLELDRNTIADWTLFKTNFGGEISMVEAFNTLAAAAVGLWSIEGSYIYPSAGASSLSVLANGYYIEDTGITDPTGMAWESSRLALYYQGNPKVFIGDNKVGIGVADPRVGMHIGSWLGYHSLSASNDLIVSNAAEIQGYLYLASRLSLGDNVSTYLQMRYYQDDGAVIGLGNTDGGANRNLIITDIANLVRDHDHVLLSADPTVFVHSSTDPDVDNTQYLSFYHDKTHGRLVTGTGIVAIGTGTPAFAAGVGSLLVSSSLEVGAGVRITSDLYVGGYTTPAQGIGFPDGISLGFGGSSPSYDARMRWDTGQTNHALLLGLSGSRSLIICEYADMATNFGHAVAANPTLYIQSSDATAPNDYVAIHHDQTRGRIETGNGCLVIGNGTPVQSLSSGDLLVTAQLEVGTYLYVPYLTVSGWSKFDSDATFKSGNYANFGANTYMKMGWNTGQTNPSFVMGVGTDSRTIIICENNDVNVDWGHSNHLNPTLYIQSSDHGNPSKYLALYHDQSNARIISGDGAVAIGLGGTPGHAGAAGDLYVQYLLEVDGAAYLDGSVDVAGIMKVGEIQNLRAVSYGSAPGTASFGSGTITANWATGKAYQKVTINADCTASSMTAPAGATKGLTLEVWATGASRNIAATAFTDVDFKGGTSLPVVIPDGDCAILTLAWDGSNYRGTVIV